MESEQVTRRNDRLTKPSPTSTRGEAVMSIARISAPKRACRLRVTSCTMPASARPRARWTRARALAKIAEHQLDATGLPVTNRWQGRGPAQYVTGCLRGSRWRLDSALDVALLREVEEVIAITGPGVVVSRSSPWLRPVSGVPRGHRQALTPKPMCSQRRVRSGAS